MAIIAIAAASASLLMFESSLYPHGALDDHEHYDRWRSLVANSPLQTPKSKSDNQHDVASAKSPPGPCARSLSKVSARLNRARVAVSGDPRTTAPTAPCVGGSRLRSPLRQFQVDGRLQSSRGPSCAVADNSHVPRHAVATDYPKR